MKLTSKILLASLVVMPGCVVCLMPTAHAEDATPPARPEQGQMREHMKDMREGFKNDHKEMRDEHKGEADAAREDCHKRMEAEKSPEGRDAIIKDCRAKQDAMRKQFFDERTKQIDTNRAEMDKERDAMRAKHEEMKAKRPAPTAAAAK